jgi:predicted DNA binding CopG/RHH family protein
MRKQNDGVLILRLPKRDEERVKKKAKQRGVKTSAWLRQVIQRALAA